MVYIFDLFELVHIFSVEYYIFICAPQKHIG